MPPSSEASRNRAPILSPFPFPMVDPPDKYLDIETETETETELPVGYLIPDAYKDHIKLTLFPNGSSKDICIGGSH